MASEQNHVAQARHNTSLAEDLAHDMVYKDWIVTAAFYAAVHYVEAMFYRERQWHTEKDRGGIPAHQWRVERLEAMTVGGKIPHRCWLIYKNLQQASNQARYLELWETRGGKTAADYFSEQTTRAFLTQDLETLKSELGY
jgi:hypothetical protein